MTRTAKRSSVCFKYSEFRPHRTRQCPSWLVQAVVQHALPCKASIPSLAMIGVMTRAATGSAHHHPATAFKTNPTTRMAERYVQKSACLASANIAALPSCSPTRFFAWERRGIATKAAQATIIPAMLCAGACLRNRLEMATKATYSASARKQAAYDFEGKPLILFAAFFVRDKRQTPQQVPPLKSPQQSCQRQSRREKYCRRRIRLQTRPILQGYSIRL